MIGFRVKRIFGMSEYWQEYGIGEIVEWR